MPRYGEGVTWPHGRRFKGHMTFGRTTGLGSLHRTGVRSIQSLLSGKSAPLIINTSPGLQRTSTVPRARNPSLQLLSKQHILTMQTNLQLTSSGRSIAACQRPQRGCVKVMATATLEPAVSLRHQKAQTPDLYTKIQLGDAHVTLAARLMYPCYARDLLIRQLATCFA